MTSRMVGTGAGPSRAHTPGNRVGRLPKEGAAPARQQSAAAWKGPLAGETFGKSRPGACPWRLPGSGPEEQNVPFTEGGAGWGWGWGWDLFSKWGAMGWIADIALMHRMASDKPHPLQPPFLTCNCSQAASWVPYRADILQRGT